MNVEVVSNVSEAKGELVACQWWVLVQYEVPQ
jgi:hypothetical protein